MQASRRVLEARASGKQLSLGYRFTDTGEDSPFAFATAFWRSSPCEPTLWMYALK
jgi:hypothetical protein